jgi:hypothetical protein
MNSTGCEAVSREIFIKYVRTKILNINVKKRNCTRRKKFDELLSSRDYTFRINQLIRREFNTTIDIFASNDIN